jgi:hypothetical protein
VLPGRRHLRGDRRRAVRGHVPGQLTVADTKLNSGQLTVADTKLNSSQLTVAESGQLGNDDVRKRARLTVTAAFPAR